MNITMIACVTSDMYIGCHNNLLVSLKPDMNHFKQVTMGHIVVMGKNTYLSLPDRKPLLGRTNVIISSTMENAPKGFLLYHAIDEFLHAYDEYKDEIFIIGGSKIYDAFMPYARKIILTHVHRTLGELDINYSSLVKFPDSIYKYKWDMQKSVDECCLHERYGLVHYNFLTLVRR